MHRCIGQDSNLRNPHGKRSTRNLRHRPGWVVAEPLQPSTCKVNRAGESSLTVSLRRSTIELPGLSSWAGLEPATPDSRSIRNLHHRPGGNHRCVCVRQSASGPAGESSPKVRNLCYHGAQSIGATPLPRGVTGSGGAPYPAFHWQEVTLAFRHRRQPANSLPANSTLINQALPTSANRSQRRQEKISP